MKTREYPYLIPFRPTLWRPAQISARLSQEVFDAVEDRRKAEQISRSELINRALALYFQQTN